MKPGDRLHAIVRSPCDQSKGFLLVEKAGIRQQLSLAFEEREATWRGSCRCDTARRRPCTRSVPCSTLTCPTQRIPGSTEPVASACLALAPFIVRPALPRMLRPNDAAEVAAIVQNQTEWNGRLLVEASIGDTSGEPANTIQLRATTPGRYVLPPARAEAMYTPEVYGRSAGGQLVVR